MKAHVADWQTVAHCVRIEPIGPHPVVRLTDQPNGLTMSNGEVYANESGYEFTGFESPTDMAASAVDLSGIFSTGEVTRADVSSGNYDGARIYYFRTSWANPVEDEEPCAAFTFGKAELTDEKYKSEMIPLVDALNQSVGHTYTAGCQKSFGQSTGPLLDCCNKDLGPLTVTGTLSAVTSRLICHDSTRTEAADYFGYGLLSFTSGANAGLRAIQIKRHEADGTIELFEAMPYPMEVGDAYSLIPGCRKRLEDCRDKWNNVINFGGFTRIPTNNQAGQWGTN